MRGRSRKVEMKSNGRNIRDSGEGWWQGAEDEDETCLNNMTIRSKYFLPWHEMRVNEATQQLHRLLWNKHPQRHISICEVTCGVSYHLRSQTAFCFLHLNCQITTVLRYKIQRGKNLVKQRWLRWFQRRSNNCDQANASTKQTFETNNYNQKPDI